MPEQTAFLFARAGVGSGPPDLQLTLAHKLLDLLLLSAESPHWLLFYTDGVRLACAGSPVLAQLRTLQERGAVLILCQTCLDYYGLGDRVAVGAAGGMPAILAAMHEAHKVIAV